MVSRSLKGSKRSTAIHLLVDQEPTTLAGSQSLCDTQVSTRGWRVPVLIYLIFTPCRVASVTAQDRDKGCGTGGVGQFDSRPSGVTYQRWAQANAVRMAGSTARAASNTRQ